MQLMLMTSRLEWGVDVRHEDRYNYIIELVG